MKPKQIDFVLFITVVILLAMGTIMVFSAGAPHAYNYIGDTYYFLKKQLIYAPIGLLLMFFTMNYNYRQLGKFSPIIFGIAVLMLIIVLTPLGVTLNGAKRWVGIGSQTIQPSEIAKYATILFLSFSLSKRKQKLQSFTKGLLPYLAILGMIAVLLLLEPHFSATVVILSVSTVILVCAGAKIKHFVLMAIPAILGIIALIIYEPYRLKRLTSFVDPFSDPQGDGWQVVQSLYAIGSGGFFGKGLGRSLQKFLYLPEPYNDFILSVLSEELGFVGIFILFSLFAVLIWRGIKIAVYAKDLFGSLVAIGITSLIAIQVIINVAVVSASMPVTGMPLPFFSYGGTSLIFLLGAVGILLNISRYAKYNRI